MAPIERLSALQLSGPAARRLHAADTRLQLRRAWPRSVDHVLVEYSAGARTVAGQWLRDGGRLTERAWQTAPDGDGVAVVPSAHLLLQHGVDRRLPGLRGVLGEPGAELVAHRPERRAVVRLPGDRYAKLVRPGRTDGLVSAARAAATVAVPTPQLLECDASQGRTVWTALPGRSWHDLLAAPQPDRAAAAAVGAALRLLHDTPPPDGLAPHTAVDEAAVVRQWLDYCAALTGVQAPPRALARVRALLAETPAPMVMAHRDFYDKQVLVTDDGTVGVLDFDTLCRAEAALDLANALAHLRLRCLQGRLSEAARGVLSAALLDGYGPGPQVTRRLPAYLAASRLRLWCVYTFRPRWRARVLPLSEPAG